MWIGNLERLCGWGILKGFVDGNLERLCGWGILKVFVNGES